jgi:hypothetical protein
MSLMRREGIFNRLIARTDVVHTGYTVDGIKSDCFLWTGPDSGAGRGGGYGRMSLNGQTVAVHLVAYGYIPGNRQVDHLCNQRKCWNPEHLELVSHQTNQKRRVERSSANSSYFNNYSKALQ